MNIKQLLKKVIELSASDLIIDADNPPMFRIFGQLTPAGDKPLSAVESSELILSLLSPEQKARLEKEKELDMAYQLGDEARFRINIHYERNNLAAALRLISTKIPTLKELNLPQEVEAFAHLPRGLVLVTGPTGSGKTTTQSSLIDIINRNYAKHIITIEDPIEYVHKNVKSIIEQREVGLDTLSFNEALKHVLRQDQDVILIGEMRDLETISTALTAAETGHLVISTLHTNDSVQAIDRIVDVFPDHQQPQIRTQLAFTLQGIIAQQLIPKKDKKGLVVAVEILQITAAVKNLIRKSQTYEIYSMIEIGKKEGMKGMDSSLKELYNQGKVSREDAIARAINPGLMEKALGPN